MSESKLRTQSMDFAVAIINLVQQLKEKRESIISNQIGRSGTSIGANIREAQYAHGKADFIAKLQIALKEANETGYWIELLSRTNYITELEYKTLESACTSIDVFVEDNHVIHPLEIKKSAAPDRREVKKYSVIDKASLQRGNGGIICMCEEPMPIDAENCLIPSNLI